MIGIFCKSFRQQENSICREEIEKTGGIIILKLKPDRYKMVFKSNLKLMIACRIKENIPVIQVTLIPLKTLSVDLSSF